MRSFTMASPYFVKKLNFSAGADRAPVSGKEVREHILWMVTRRSDDKRVVAFLSGYTVEQLPSVCSSMQKCWVVDSW